MFFTILYIFTHLEHFKGCPRGKFIGKLCIRGLLAFSEDWQNKRGGLGTIWGHLEAILTRSWGSGRHPGPVLELSRAFERPSWPNKEPSWSNRDSSAANIYIFCMFSIHFPYVYICLFTFSHALYYFYTFFTVLYIFTHFYTFLYDHWPLPTSW